MTFLEMQNDALDLLHEIKNHPSYSLTTLKQYINRGSIEFVRKTNCIESTVDITTVANQFEYTEADASDLQYLKLPYQVRYVDGDEVGTALTQYRGGYNNLPQTKSYGTPDSYWLRNIGGRSRGATPVSFTGVRIGTWPIANTSAKTLRVDGFMWPVTLVNDNDVPEYKDAWHDAPVLYATYRMFLIFSHLRKGWHDKAINTKALFDEVVATAKEDLSIQDDSPIIPVDVTERDAWRY